MYEQSPGFEVNPARSGQRWSDHPRMAWREWLVPTVFGAVFVMGLAGCSVGPVVTGTVMAPAQSDAAVSRRQIAVLPFEQGRRDPDISAEIETMLVNVQFDGRPFFTVVERRQLRAVLNELRLVEGGLVRDDRAAAAGRMLGATAVLTGHMVRHEVERQPYEAQRQVCVRQEQRTDRSGRPQPGRCLEWGTRAVWCERERALVVLRPRLVDVEAGTIVFAQELLGQAEASRCSDDPTAPVAPSVLLDDARAQAVAQLRAALAPTARRVALPLLRAWHGPPLAEARALHDRALKFASAGRMDRACELWSQAQAMATGLATVMHNLGVCAEQQGGLEQAESWYRQADAATSRPDRTIGSALQRAQQAQADRIRLQRQRSGGS